MCCWVSSPHGLWLGLLHWRLVSFLRLLRAEVPLFASRCHGIHLCCCGVLWICCVAAPLLGGGGLASVYVGCPLPGGCGTLQLRLSMWLQWKSYLAVGWRGPLLAARRVCTLRRMHTAACVYSTMRTQQHMYTAVCAHSSMCVQPLVHIVACAHSSMCIR